jgi:hypothetical protein
VVTRSAVACFVQQGLHCADPPSRWRSRLCRKRFVNYGPTRAAAAVAAVLDRPVLTSPGSAKLKAIVASL